MAKNIKTTNQKELKQKKSDIAYFKMSMMFFLSFISILFIARLSSSAASSTGVWFWRVCRNPAYLGVVAAIFVAAAVFFCYKKFVKKQDESLKYISSTNLLFITGYVLAASLFFGHANSPQLPLLCGTVVLILLYYIFNIYKRDFFVYSLVNAVMFVLLWMFAFKTGVVYLLVKIALVLAMAAFVFFVKGKVNAATVSRITQKNGKNKLFDITLLVSLAFFAVLLFLPYVYTLSGAINFIIMLVQYIIAGIAFTVNLIK